MPVQSKLFTRDAKVKDRLNNCMASHAHNIRPGSSGDHVSAIQTALFILDNAAIPAGELSSSRYGTETAKAVANYKDKRAILGPGQTQVDNIVGIQTITRLDKEMGIKEDGGGGVLPVPPPPPSPIPGGKFQFIAPPLPLRIKFQPEDPSKQDMENSPVERVIATNRARLAARPGVFSATTEETCKQKLRAMTSKGGPRAQDMAEFFFTNATVKNTRKFADGSFFSTRVKSDISFTRNHTRLNFAIKDALQQIANQAQESPKRIDVGLLREGATQPQPLLQFANNISFAFQSDLNRALRGDPLAFAIGDIQGLDVQITSFRSDAEGNFEGTLSYLLMDHYGSDDADVVDGGQASLWLLQRKMVEGQSTNGFEPYIVHIQVNNMSFGGKLS